MSSVTMSKGDQTTVKQILALPKQNAIDTNDQIQQFEDKVMSINSQSSVVPLTNLPKRPPVDVAFNDITFSVSERHRCQKISKTILKGISGSFGSGKLTALMGPSGAGKSSLLNILVGYRTSNVKGTILINGKKRNLNRFREISSYIMQDDCLISQLTVKEAMMISAALKLGKQISLAEKQLVVSEVILAIGLISAMKTKTMDLSGGQRKRLAIALELVNNPPVMFFDEPTSGLDSSTCFVLLSLLQTLAQGGRTIVCTIHQPSARLFEKFDHLYMLAEGQCIYQGRVSGLVPFLGSFGYACPSYHNPADYIMEVASGEYGKAVPILVMATNVHRNNQEVLSESNNDGEYIKTFPTPSFIQFWILLKRTFKTTLRDKQLMHLRVAAHIIVGAIIGMIYYDVGRDASKVRDNLGCVFFAMLFTMFTGMMPTILTFPQEIGVFVREYQNNWYSMRAFYFAKTVADIPFNLLFSGVYVITMYYLTSQPAEVQRVSMFVFICVLTSLVAQSLGLLIGAGLSVESGVFIGPISCIPTILFSGFFVRFDSIPVYIKWLSYVSYLRYGFEGAVLAIYKKRAELMCSDEYCYYETPDEILGMLSMRESEYWIDVFALISIFIGLRIIAYFCLRVKVYSIR